MAKAKVEKKLAQTLSEREQAVKVLEEEKVDRIAANEAIKREAFEQAKQEVMAVIITFGMSFKRSTLFMIKKKYLDLDLSDIDGGT